MLVGRERQRGQIDEALERARAGASTPLVLVGEAGIGKTVLLDYAAERAAGMQVLRARGVESEARIPFASLLELLRPALGVMDRIPEPQAAALEGALALRPARAQQRFAVGAATLSLLAAYSERGPVAVLIDDAHWLDDPSAQALLFAVRRLFADPIAVLICVRQDEPSWLDGTDLRMLQIPGLAAEETETLLDGISPEVAARLHEATAGNPLALLELAHDADDWMLAPEGAPLLVSTRISEAFLRRLGELGESERLALLLAATSDTGDLVVLERAADRLGIDLSRLTAGERAGLLSVRAGSVEFRHPLARSAVYAAASPEQRRDTHRALASALPDRDIDRRAWHLASAAAGLDESASAALEQAALRAHDRSAYATAAGALERSGRLTADHERRARLLCRAASETWHAGSPTRAIALLAEARSSAGDPATLLDIDELAGYIATRQGPVMSGHAILTAAAERAHPERAVAMLAEATGACFFAGNPTEMLSVAERAWALSSQDAAPRSRFLAQLAVGMARVAGGDAAAGAAAVHEAIAIVNAAPELREDVQLLPWLASVPIFLREAGTGRPLLDQALQAARARAAIGVLPYVLSLVALDHATTDSWAVAEATYLEAIDLARETGQQTDLVLALSGLARLQARRGRESECRAAVAEALELCDQLGTRLFEVWATEACGMLELGLGETQRAIDTFQGQQRIVEELAITDADLSPGPELVDALVRVGRAEDARGLAEKFSAGAQAKGLSWSLARALRCQGLLASDGQFSARFEEALAHHAQTPDAFETARTRLAYGERLRRARDRKLAREQLRAALITFERLAASPWIERTRGELAATGETLRRRDPTTRDELTPQELQIALLLAAGKTTREAAAALFLSPKTIEYHLRHVYGKLDIHSRDELARALEVT